MKELLCAKCGTLMAEVRDGSVRKDIVVLCPKCAYPEKPRVEVPECMREIFNL